MLWDKKDNLYAEGSTIRTCGDNGFFGLSTFYYYYPNYSDFYISTDFTEAELFTKEDKNIFNYTFKDALWATYIGKDMKYIKYEFNNGGSILPRTILKASNGFGKQSAVLFQFKSKAAGVNSPNFDVINIQGCRGVLFKEITTNDYWVLLNLTYQESSNTYVYNADIYDCGQKRWVGTSTHDDYYNLKMPSGYNPQEFSKYFPNFLVSLNPDGTEGANSYSFRNFFGYSVNITKAEAEEIINGKFFYSKTNNSMYALYYNECTNIYSNTTFYKDGTILPKGQLVEGAINQICKNGDIKSQEFIEY